MPTGPAFRRKWGQRSERKDLLSELAVGAFFFDDDWSNHSTSIVTYKEVVPDCKPVTAPEKMLKIRYTSGRKMLRLPCSASLREAECAAGRTSRQLVPLARSTIRHSSSIRRIQLLVLQPTTSRQVFTPFQSWPPRRSFSDKLLGHSPMGAAPPPLSSQSTQIPTKEEAEIGGVWVKESAKRDKLLELKSELATATTDTAVPSLDAAATERQKLDLWLVDGLKLLALQTEQQVEAAATTTEKTTTTTTRNRSNSHHENLQPIVQSIQEKLDKLPEQLHQVQWEEFLLDVKQDLTQRLNSFPADRCFLPIRDYYDASSELATAEKAKQPLSNEVRQWIERQQQQQQTSDPALWNNFNEAVTRVRLQTAVALTDHLHATSCWKTLTAVTHQDVDRAAVRHQVVGDATTLPRDKLMTLLEAFLMGSGAERFDALWRLLDKDDDRMLDQEEVQHVANLAIAPVQTALQTVLQEALDASDPAGQPAVGWRQRRRQAKEKRRLAKLFGKAVRRFFAEDLQQPHRLRCVYAWANKAHQGNKVDSVLVEEEGDAAGGSGGGGGVGTTLMGRKRYVELQPKISLPEFREVQSIHFPQLDRVGSELLESFRDDLLVDQGKGRQRRELLRDCALFFVGVCAVDYVILAL